MEQMNVDKKLPNHDYADVQQSVRETFATRFAIYGPHLFATKSDGLSTRYVMGFPAEHQQHHNCNACRDFIRQYGHAVFIDDTGETVPALWDHTVTPEEYRGAIKALEDQVASQGIRTQFFTPNNTWGHAEKNGWLHLAVDPSLTCTSLIEEDEIGTAIGDHNQLFDLLLEAVTSFTPAVAREAYNLLRSEATNKTRDFAGQQEWFVNFLVRLERAEGNVGRIRNLVRREVAGLEPKSFARIGTTVIGNMMQDIKDGLHTDEITGRFNAQTKVTEYQKTTAPVTEGSLDVARKTFADLGLSGRELKRRLATLEEIRYNWKPQPVAADAPKEDVLFGGVEKIIKQDSAVATSIAEGGRIAWDKFQAKVLPGAQSIKVYLESAPGGYTFYTTQADPEALPLYFYDLPEDRNPVSWFVRVNGETGRPTVQPHHLGLSVGFHEIAGISSIPCGWTGGERGAQYDGIVMILPKTRTDVSGVGGAIHTVMLRDDLRVARRVIEANNPISEMGQLAPEGNAVGLRIDSKTMAVRVQVTDQYGTTEYIIDRME